jgi:hypothetical protein
VLCNRPGASFTPYRRTPVILAISSWVMCSSLAGMARALHKGPIQQRAAPYEDSDCDDAVVADQRDFGTGTIVHD